MKIETKLGEKAKLPCRKHETDGGADLYVSSVEKVNGEDIYNLGKVEIPPHGSVIVNTGVSMAIPRGYIGDIRPRSGLFFHCGIFCAGTIDSDYRGEIKVCLRNLSDEPYFVESGDRVAQICIVPVELCEFEEVSQLPDTERGNGGFGSTGAH